MHYLDINGEKQAVTVALAIENTKNGTTWLPHNSIQSVTFTQDSLPEFFTSSTKIEPGTQLSVVFGLDSKQPTIPGGKHNPELIRLVYDQTQIDSFVSSGDPEEMDYLIVPTSVNRTSD